MDNNFQTTINGEAVNVDNKLQGYTLFKKPSSHVNYYGTHRDTSSLFVQYNNGTCFIFTEVPDPLLAKAEVAPSIGKFLHAFTKDLPVKKLGD
jgi:hypothetical protein